MANTNAPFGLKPLRYMSGAPYNGAANLYYTTANLFIGDPVIRTTDSNSAEYYGNPIGSLPAVVASTATSGRITGVVVGFFAEQATSPVYNPASTGRGVYVADDPGLVFAVQDDGSGTPAYTWTNANANMNAGSGGSTATALSSWVITGSTVGAAVGSDSAYQVKVLRFRPIVGNQLGDYAQWEVMINLPTNVHDTIGY